MSDEQAKLAKATQSLEEAAATEDLYGALGSVSGQLEAIQQFVARRFDEISMEVNATSQQVDMAEDGTARKFGEIFEVLKAISFSDGGDTPANTGVELDAVIETTEAAANKILDAAEGISDDIMSTNWDDADIRKATLDKMQNGVQDIIMACSFQDVTGQRINKTLENIRGIEDRLGGALEAMGIDVETPTTTESKPAVEGAETEKGASQADIDSMFD